MSDIPSRKPVALCQPALTVVLVHFIQDFVLRDQLTVVTAVKKKKNADKKKRNDHRRRAFFFLKDNFRK